VGQWWAILLYVKLQLFSGFIFVDRNPI